MEDQENIFAIKRIERKTTQKIETDITHVKKVTKRERERNVFVYNKQFLLSSFSFLIKVDKEYLRKGRKPFFLSVSILFIAFSLSICHFQKKNSLQISEKRTKMILIIREWRRKERSNKESDSKENDRKYWILSLCAFDNFT